MLIDANPRVTGQATFIAVYDAAMSPDKKFRFCRDIVLVVPLPTCMDKLNERAAYLFSKRYAGIEPPQFSFWRMRVKYTKRGLPAKTFAPEQIVCNQRTGEVHTDADTWTACDRT